LNLKLNLGHYFNDPKFLFEPKGKLYDYTFSTYNLDSNWNVIPTRNQIRNFVEPENGYWWSSNIDFSKNEYYVDEYNYQNFYYKAVINFSKSEKDNNNLLILNEEISDTTFSCLDYFDNELQSKLAGMHANVRCLKNK
jgi:hypothetical protein